MSDLRSVPSRHVHSLYMYELIVYSNYNNYVFKQKTVCQSIGDNELMHVIKCILGLGKVSALKVF